MVQVGLCVKKLSGVQLEGFQFRPVARKQGSQFRSGGLQGGRLIKCLVGFFVSFVPVPQGDS